MSLDFTSFVILSTRIWWKSPIYISIYIIGAISREERCYWIRHLPCPQIFPRYNIIQSLNSEVYCLNVGVYETSLSCELLRQCPNLLGLGCRYTWSRFCFVFVWWHGSCHLYDRPLASGSSRFRELVVYQRPVTAINYIHYCAKTPVPQVLEPGYYLRAHLSKLWKSSQSWSVNGWYGVFLCRLAR